MHFHRPDPCFWDFLEGARNWTRTAASLALIQLSPPSETYGLINTSARDDNIGSSTTKLIFRRVKHSLQLSPLAHIRSLKSCSTKCVVFWKSVFGYAFFCFWPESEIGKENIAAARQQKIGEAKIDS